MRWISASGNLNFGRIFCRTTFNSFLSMNPSLLRSNMRNSLVKSSLGVFEWSKRRALGDVFDWAVVTYHWHEPSCLSFERRVEKCSRKDRTRRRIYLSNRCHSCSLSLSLWRWDAIRESLVWIASMDSSRTESLALLFFSVNAEEFQENRKEKMIEWMSRMEDT